LSAEEALIRDVTNMLKNLIKDNITELNGATSVVLESPGEIVPQASQNQLSLFLYGISENPFLKNQDFHPEGPDKLHYPPIPLDLFYLLTPYAKDKEMEQIILAKILRLFYDNSILSGPILGNNLLDAGNKDLRIVMSTLPLDQINHLWGLFPGKSYRLGLYYMITPLYIPSTRELDVQRVVTKQISYYGND
jgi:hypothetical protein